MGRLLAFGAVLVFVLVAGYFIRKAWIAHAATARRVRLASRNLELMRERVGITVPARPAPAQDPNRPNPANYDETKVPPFKLPDPLLLKNGERVGTPEVWWEQRRPEIVNDFEREVYGRVPETVPSVTWRVVSEEVIDTGSVRANQKMLIGRVDNSAFPEVSVEIRLALVTPAEVGESVPVVLRFGSLRRGRGDWKSLLLSKRWGYAILDPWSVQPDDGASLNRGIIGLTGRGQPRRPDDWGALRAWAWGASRAFDYLETDSAVDSHRIAIEGLSRYGKAALVAMALDQRFSLGLIASSGAGGAKILRRRFAEQLENVVVRDNFFWFCGNFLKYASELTPDDLPVDAHELVALCAPRPVFISAGSLDHGDRWVDPKGMFLAAVHAEPVYTLLGKRGLGTTTFPPEGTALIAGELAFRQHHSGHTVEPNWPVWIEWARRYWTANIANRH
ncbi:MAG TPA: acetylxylan esterase [Cyclobacteriaceae bacterium]